MAPRPLAVRTATVPCFAFRHEYELGEDRIRQIAAFWRKSYQMLQACVDDSGNLYQGKTSVLVGYVASAESWIGFAYLKASDAMALSKKGEFRGWTPEARDAKPSHLIDVINETQILYGAAAIINNADFLRIASKHPDPKISDPFFFLFAQVLRGPHRSAPRSRTEGKG